GKALRALASSVLVLGSGVDRQFDNEGCALPGGALRADRAPVFANDPVAKAQAQACTLAHRLGREKRIENLGQVLGCNPGAVISDLDLNCSTHDLRLDLNTSRRLMRLHRLSAVIQDVQDDL